ncbi:cysteine desulfurase NifS [Neobittarella massiliensis]|uniref:Cysteine desulfurase IscS n=1 Tax=Neobittarella massiliensis (ex Bilen et al. 2018) TaxID=2041842 RepID=A0A8J6IPB0_9FIRM|nr:cysteine desulfurase NifS [Neobittarella massiliensis]MBC3516537.1 cysteine desulfurase NifS [Neobittarella massiliensis]
MKKFIYADNAATTPVSQPVLEAMLPYLEGEYGNPSSIYEKGRRALAAIEEARRQVADALHCKPREIYFTGCGSEADNWAIKGAAMALYKKGKKHVITTVFEHHAVLHTTQKLEKLGMEVTYLPVDENGLLTAEDVKAAIRPDTALVSIMYANNEIGTVLPIAEIGAVCRQAGVLFHTDAVQAVGNVEIDVQAQNIDMLSLSAHKFHGPKGVGALYIRSGVRIENFLDGGGQEGGHRAGTENVASIVGMGRAIELACAPGAIAKKRDHLVPLRDKIIAETLKLPHTRLNGHPTQRLPGTINISFEGVEGESLLLMLDLAGIAASSGSACTSGSLDPSHVLLSLGLSHDVAHGSLRLSLAEDITAEDADYIISSIPPVIERLRAMSPLWEKIVKEEQAGA